MSLDRVHLAHIADAISFVRCITYPDTSIIHRDRLTRDATLRNLHTLSECTQRLSESLKSECPDIPWQQISKFRSVVVHNFVDLKLDLIEAVIVNDLSELQRAVEHMSRICAEQDSN